LVRWSARRWLWQCGQLLLVWLPAVILGLAGAMYLWQVKLAVEDSLPPALYDYIRRQAQLEVQVERVSLHWGRIVLTRPGVRLRTGEWLLRARYLEISLPASGEPLTVELDCPEVWLQRNRQGMWNIDSLLRQPRPPEPTPFTFRLRAKRGTLYYDDFLPDVPVRATLWADEFTLSQLRIGQAVMLRGVGDALGTVEARALSDGKHWLVEVDADGVQGARFKPYLPRGALDLEQTTGRVAVQIRYAPNQPLQVLGIAEGIAQNATFRKKLLPWRTARFQLRFTESWLSGKLTSDDGRVQVQGLLDWSGAAVEVAAQVQASGDDAADLWRLLRDDPSLVQGRYQARVRLQGALDCLQVYGVAAVERVRTPQGDLRHLRGSVAFSQGQLLLPDLRAEYSGCPVQGKLWLDTRPNVPRLRLYATVKGLPLQRVPALRERSLDGDANVALLALGQINAPAIEAHLQMDSLRYTGQRVGGLRMRLQYADGVLRIPLATLQGALGAIQVSGEIANIEGKNARLDLSVNANEVNLNLIAQLLGYEEGVFQGDAGESLRLDGVGYLSAQLRGSLREPEAVVKAVVFDGRVGDIGAEVAVMELNLVGREVCITQLQILRRAAQLFASGTVQLPDAPEQPMRFRLEGSLYEFDLASIPDWLRRELPLAGLASGEFQWEGEPRQWRLRARLNAESIQYDQTLLRENAAQVVVEAKEGVVQVQAESIQARLGDGALTASGQWRSDGWFEAQWTLENTSLEVLTPYLPVEYRLSGQATVHGEATGTPDAPTVQLRLRGSQIVLNRTALGDAEATVTVSAASGLTVFKERTPVCLHPQPSSYPVREGCCFPPRLFAGARDTAEEGATVQHGVAGICAIPVHGEPERSVLIRGDTGGEGEKTHQHFRACAGKVCTRPRIVAQMVLRAPEGAIQLELDCHDWGREALQLTVVTTPLPVEWLRQAVRAVPDLLPPAMSERFETLEGQVQASLRCVGALQEPRAQLHLNAETLEWRGQSLGSLSVQAEWTGASDTSDLASAFDATRALEAIRRLRTQRMVLHHLRWQAETARLEARGVYTPERLTADVEVAQLPLRWARLWEPSLPEFDGAFDLSLLATGTPQSPELTLSATVNQLTYAYYTIDQILFSQVEVREGAVQTDDALIRMGDYQARLSGRLPFRWSPLGIPRDEPIQVAVRLREQPLSLLRLFFPIDTERTRGVLEASLEIGGTLAEPQPRGYLQITNGALALHDLNTTLQGVGLQVAFDGREARIVRAQAQSSEGGSLRVAGSVVLSGEQAEANLTVYADTLAAREPKLPVLGGSAQAVLSGTVQVQGALTEPLVKGTLRAPRGFLYLPPELPERIAGEPLPIHPRFDLRVEIADEFTLRNPNLDARLEGVLQVGGALQALTLLGEFNLRGGVLNLPTARLRLEPDSVARLNYPYTGATGETIARIELAVRASTSIVAPDFTGDPVRYRVELEVRGPLDDPERLQLTARSEPPGLSEQRILSLLGRGQALAALVRGADPARVFREQLSDILTAQVLPALLAPLETGIAEALDLEQFTLDYTGLRPASLYLVKNLFDGVGIAYRRGIGVAGNEYQARIFYRLPFRNRLLQRLRVGFGFEHTGNRFLFVDGSLLFR